MKWSVWAYVLAADIASALPQFLNSGLIRKQILTSYSLPNGQILRTTGITAKRSTFLYGPGIGGGPASPTGPLGLALVAADSAITDSELAAEVVIDTEDTTIALAKAPSLNLKTLDDYTKLYDGTWRQTTAPTGVTLGMLTNYTQDLLFSMERLSINPYSVRRLIPGKDNLPFDMSDGIVQNITGLSLKSLLSNGRLFYVDYRSQAELPRSANYAAACDAYFYIAPSSDEFLPLAIRTNFGNNLIYTPADSNSDWMLAKIMFNVNDFFFAQFHHLANTHFVTEVAYQAAIRSFSDDHPILAVFKRLMYGAFGIRPLAVAVLFRPGGSVDQFFGYSGEAAATLAADLYDNGYAGAVQSNYFNRNLQRRGLVDSEFGPALKHFPFYEDALPIYNAIHDFMSVFINSYYTSDAAVVRDPELQAWLLEANGPAGLIDFPTSASMKTRTQLVDLLTHFAHLVSSAHHTVNTNQLITTSGVLPFHPSALHKQVPTSKGVQNPAEFLPPMSHCISMINNQAYFSRPLLAGTNRSLLHMFDDPIMLSRLNSKTRAANQNYINVMRARSQVIRNRNFDTQGLSQGMPFIWQALDPNVAPWSLKI